MKDLKRFGNKYYPVCKHCSNLIIFRKRNARICLDCAHKIYSNKRISFKDRFFMSKRLIVHDFSDKNTDST